MRELDKNQSANCIVHTGLILDSQDSSSSKTIAPPTVSETTAPASVSISIAPPSSQNQSVNTEIDIRNLNGTVGTWYRVPVPRYFFMKYRGTLSNSRVIEIFFCKHCGMFCFSYRLQLQRNFLIYSSIITNRHLS